MNIAFCGNPNVGKTTLYNRITHSDAPVGNWHGVTVDVTAKRCGDVVISDLPGAYSLTPRTAEENITCEQILFGSYDVFVYVAEVNNLRRNLYMLMQLKEAGKKAVLVVNMMDEARGKVDLNALQQRLGLPVIGTSVKHKNPKAAILTAVKEAAVTPVIKPSYIDDGAVKALAQNMKKSNSIGLPIEFVALKVLERDDKLLSRLNLDGETSCGNLCTSCSACDTDMPARLRYEYIDSVLRGVTDKQQVNMRTSKIDRVVLGRLALPIFLLVMAAVFVITFEAGKPLSNLLSSLIDRLMLPVRASEMPEWVISLLCGGLIAGVGSVLSFLPQIVLLFLLTAVLQDSGYMSRVAFVTDDFFKKFGLSGRAAFSVVLGLGCSATAVLTTRGIAGDKARRRAAFATPFCPCSARLAVFTAICSYFGLSGLFVAAMYILGFAAALAVLKVMQISTDKKSKGDDDALIMEMPPYRLPRLKRVASLVWRNVLSFVLRVGSVVLGVSVIMWLLCNFSFAYGFTGGVETSLMNTVTGLVAPIFKPLGFGNWKAVTALVSGVAAKETVISVIAALGGMSEVFDSNQAAVSFMIFTCLYVPCVATLSAISKENGIKSALMSVVVHTVTAYVAALVYYQGAKLFAADKTVFFVVLSIAFAAVMCYIIFVTLRRKHRGKKARIKS